METLDPHLVKILLGLGLRSVSSSVKELECIKKYTGSAAVEPVLYAISTFVDYRTSIENLPSESCDILRRFIASNLDTGIPVLPTLLEPPIPICCWA